MPREIGENWDRLSDEDKWVIASILRGDIILPKE